MEFIESGKRENGKVLIHCEKGISRSSTITIAYLIWKKKMTQQNAFTLVKKRRSIIDPNFGFLVQLANFYKRLYAPDELSSNYTPKMFAIGCHQPEDPNTIVVRLIDKLYHKVGNKPMVKLDPRGMFIIENKDHAFFWIGTECNEGYEEKFYNKAKDYFPKLQQYENFTKNIIEV